MRLWLARHPERLKDEHPILIDELLDLSADGKQRGLSMIIEMLSDLYQNGRQKSRFV